MKRLVISAILMSTIGGAFAQSVTTKIKKPSAWQKIKENTSMFVWSEFRGGNVDKPGNELTFNDQGEETDSYMSMWTTANINYKLSNTTDMTFANTFSMSSDPTNHVEFHDTRIRWRKRFKPTDKVSMSIGPRMAIDTGEGSKNVFVEKTGETRFGEITFIDSLLLTSYKATNNFTATVAVLPRFYNLRIGSGDRYRMYTSTTFAYSFSDAFTLYSEFNFNMHNDRNDVITKLEEREGRAGEDLVIAASIAVGGVTVEPFLSFPTNSGSNSENTQVGFRLMGAVF